MTSSNIKADEPPISREAFLKESFSWLKRSGQRFVSHVVDETVAPFIPTQASTTSNTATALVACIELTECTAYRGSGCVACYEACPEQDQAIVLNEALPQVIASACTGCEDCLPACPTEGAIAMVPAHLLA